MGKLRLCEVKVLRLLTRVWGKHEPLGSHFLNKSSSSSSISLKQEVKGEREGGPYILGKSAGLSEMGVWEGGTALLQGEATGCWQDPTRCGLEQPPRAGLACLPDPIGVQPLSPALRGCGVSCLGCYLAFSSVFSISGTCFSELEPEELRKC